MNTSVNIISKNNRNNLNNILRKTATHGSNSLRLSCEELQYFPLCQKFLAMQYLFNPSHIEEMPSLIRQMLEEEKLRNKLRRKESERAKLFTSEKMTNKISIFMSQLY